MQIWLYISVCTDFGGASAGVPLKYYRCSVAGVQYDNFLPMLQGNSMPDTFGVRRGFLGPTYPRLSEVNPRNSGYLLL